MTRMKRLFKNISVLMVLILMVSSINISATLKEDQAILSAEIANVYNGRSEAPDIRSNINFTDVASNYWGREAIMRMGALDITKGYMTNGTREFRPTQDMSKQETLAFILRAIGQEEQAKIIAEALVPGLGETTSSLWSKGYLTLANQLGMISNAELVDALAADQSLLDPALNFLRTSPVSRELAAKWIVQGINSQNPEIIVPLYRQQSIFTFKDWEKMGIAYIPYIEAVVEAKIMKGDGSLFNPKGSLSRAEMMQMMENMDKLLYDTMNLSHKSGYVGHSELDETSSGEGAGAIYTAWIRVSDGSVDQLVKDRSRDMLNRETTLDALVYKGNKIVSLQDLKEGDTIHYVVNDESKEVYYVEVVSSGSSYTVSGILDSLNDIGNGNVTIINNSGRKQTYTLSSSLYDNVNKTIVVNEMFVSYSDAPVTNVVDLIIKNQLVTKIDFGGVLSSAYEINGLVIEHNREFDYIRISNWDGVEVVKRYNENSVTVEKEQYYDDEDQVGYFDELFPYYGFDEDDAHVDQIEVGDIIHVQLDPANTEMITKISAKTNYSVKFGEVLTSVYKGDAGYALTLKMDDFTTVSYNVADDIAVIKGSKNLKLQDVKSGDLVRILVNQAVVAPGTIEEGIKEIMIDPNGNILQMIYKGELGSVDPNQETISVLNSYELVQTGWKNYKTSRKLDASKSDIDYYYGGDRITLAYAEKYLRSSGMDMYVATEKYFNEERITKVTFRDNRDSVLAYSNVTLTNGFNQLETQNHEGTIKMDLGTIVVKNNKIIAPSNVIAPDYTQVVLNGNNQAAIVQVKPEPNNDAVSVSRGRLAKINDYEDFTLQSHASLVGMDWIYSPIERVYKIDYTTVIKDATDIIGINTFIGYSDTSKVDKLYTIVSEGVNATHIIEGPYAKDGVMGEVFALDTTDSKISLKDTLVYDKTTKQWNELSRPNSYSQAEVFNESIIIKNNHVISLEELEIGDQLRILTTIDLAEQLKLEDSREFPGYILFVE